MPITVCAEAGAASPEALKRMGFTHVRITQRWEQDETREGWLALEHHEALLEQAEEAGLKAVLRVELGRAPVWLFGKYPDAHLNGRDGAVCMHHPGVMSDTLYFVRTLARSLSKYACITHWELHEAKERGVCACEYAMDAYREYLRDTFGSIRAYNDACSTRYADFEGVAVLAEAEAARFDVFRRVHAPAAQLAELKHAFAECDPARREVLYLTPMLTPEGALHPYDDAYEAEGLPDAEAGYNAETRHMLMTMDIKRPALPPGAPLIVDIAAPHGALDLHTPSARDARRAVAAALMGGATGFAMTGFPSAEALGAAGALGAALGPYEDILSAHESVAVTTALVEPGDAGGFGWYSLRAWHALLTAHGVSVDIVRAPSDKHEVIIYPACRAPEWDAVEGALKRGCNVLLEAHPSLLGAHNRERLAALFGVKAGLPRVVEEPAPARMLPRPTFVEDRLPPTMLEGCAALEGHALRASLYLAGLEPLAGTNALLSFGGGAALTARNIGAGKALLLSTCGAVCVTAHRDDRSDAALAALLNLMGIKSAPSRALMRLRERDGARCAIAVNPAPNAEDVPLPGGGALRVEPHDAVVGAG